jgi:diadenylate cyclase
MEWIARFTSMYDRVSPVLDVLLLAFLFYKTYDLLLKTQAAQLIRGAVFLALVYGTAVLFRLNTLEWLLRSVAPGLLIAVAVVFQPELRRIFIRLGQGELFRADSKPRLGLLEAVVTAAEILSSEKRGMLVVFSRRVNIRTIIETGTRLNAEISSSLLVTIFEFDTPLHDGAVVIQNNRIVSAGCILPVSEQSNIKKSFGTRHRAALGMSEQSDAVILVVSEETGAISIAYDGQIFYDLSTIEITRKIRDYMGSGSKKEEVILDKTPLPLNEKE